MEFHDLFREHIPQVNKRAESDDDIASALAKYEGERFVLSVKGDATYVFAIREDGVDYEAHEGNPGDVAGGDDMFVEMDPKRARKLIEKQTLGLTDLPFIKHRNIGMEDVNFAKRLFERKT